MTKFDYGWGCIVGFEGNEDLAQIIIKFATGFTG